MSLAANYLGRYKHDLRKRAFAEGPLQSPSSARQNRSLQNASLTGGTTLSIVPELMALRQICQRVLNRACQCNTTTSHATT